MSFGYIADQTCPMRRLSLGRCREGEDGWIHRRWGRAVGRALAWWIRNGPIGKRLRAWQTRLWKKKRHRLCRLLPNPGGGGTRWGWHWQPRCCSFCGGIQPEDAIQLIAEGWWLQGTDKPYKFYLHPRWRRYEPTPPVKLYLPHINENQSRQLNDVLLEARV